MVDGGESWWAVAQFSLAQIKFFLYYCVIILGFLFVNCVNILQIQNKIKH